MSSHAHVQLWRATPHKDDKRFLAYMEGLTDIERWRRKQKRERTGPANNLSARLTKKMHLVASLLEERGVMKLGDLARNVGVEPGRLGKAMMNAEHLYLFYEENIGGRVYIGLFKEMTNDKHADSN